MNHHIIHYVQIDRTHYLHLEPPPITHHHGSRLLLAQESIDQSLLDEHVLHPHLPQGEIILFIESIHLHLNVLVFSISNLDQYHLCLDHLVLLVHDNQALIPIVVL